MRSGDVDGEVKAHLVETVVDSGGRKDTDVFVFYAKGVANNFKVA